LIKEEFWITEAWAWFTLRSFFAFILYRCLSFGNLYAQLNIEIHYKIVYILSFFEADEDSQPSRLLLRDSRVVDEIGRGAKWFKSRIDSAASIIRNGTFLHSENWSHKSGVLYSDSWALYNVQILSPSAASTSNANRSQARYARK
jgi:hypothetical protein